VIQRNTNPQKVYLPIAPEIEQIGKVILNAAFKVHTILGPGLMESVYETCLAYEIRKSGIEVYTQVFLPVIYEGIKIDAGLRLDILVGNCIIVEIKAVETMNPLYVAQILTYLRLSEQHLGFLINFNVLHLKDGIKRIIL
jgi:GxxExxY protein